MFISIHCKHIYAYICMQFKYMYNFLLILDTSNFNYKINIIIWNNESTQCYNLHACIYPKMTDQTVNSICAFIISNNNTDF